MPVGTPFERRLLNPLEELVELDHNKQAANLVLAISELQKNLFSKGLGQGSNRNVGTPQSGFLGSGFKVKPQATPNGTVRIQAGLGWQYLTGTLADGHPSVMIDFAGLLGVNEDSYYKPLLLPSDVSITPQNLFAGNPATDIRCDIVEVRCNRQVTTDTPYLLNTATKTYALSGSPLNKTLRWDLDSSLVGYTTEAAASTAAISVRKGGTISASPAKPATTAGYVAIAYIYVHAGDTTFDYDRIVDARPLLLPFGGATLGIVASISNALGVGPPTLSGAVAPPGIECYAVQDGSNNKLVHFYLLGNFTQASVVGQEANAVSGAVPVTALSAVPYNLTATDVSRINSSLCSAGATKCHFGQPAVYFTALLSSTTATFNALVTVGV